MMKNLKLDLPIVSKKSSREVNCQTLIPEPIDPINEQELQDLEKACQDQLVEGRSSERTRDGADPNFMKATISSEPDIWISINQSQMLDEIAAQNQPQKFIPKTDARAKASADTPSDD